jgi:hypothetical protein
MVEAEAYPIEAPRGYTLCDDTQHNNKKRSIQQNETQHNDTKHYDILQNDAKFYVLLS